MPELLCKTPLNVITAFVLYQFLVMRGVKMPFDVLVISGNDDELAK